MADISFGSSRAKGKVGLLTWDTRVTIMFFEAFTGHVRVEALDSDGDVLEAKTVSVDNQTSAEVRILGAETHDVIVKVSEA